MNQQLLALYGLKWNPFLPEVPTEALYVPPKVENFCWRIEQAHLRDGGFALIHGYEKEPVMERAAGIQRKTSEFAKTPSHYFGHASRGSPLGSCPCQFRNSQPITMFG